jgi:hypothetical protein
VATGNAASGRTSLFVRAERRVAVLEGSGEMHMLRRCRPRSANRNRAVLASILASLPISATTSLFAADVTSTWIGPAFSVGSWSVPSNWSNTPAVAQFPNNGNGGFTYDAIIANSGTALLSQNIDLQNLTLSESFIDGDFNLVLHQGMTWSGGGMRGNGTTTIPAGATLTLGGSNRRTLTRTLENFGTTTWLSGGLTGDTFSALGVFNNEPGATFLARDTFTTRGAFGIGSFINSGTIIKDAGAESRWGGITAFSNTGTLMVQTGMIRFPGPMAQMSNGALMAGTWIVDATTAAGGSATLLFDRDDINTIGAAARVELIGAGSSFSKLATLAGNQGVFRIASGRNFSTLAGYNNSGTTIVGTGTAMEVNGDVQNTGTIDINAGMVVRYTTTSPLPALRAQIAAARNFGSWNMPGITSTNARNAPAHNTTLGIMEGTEFQSIYGTAAPFFGYASNNTSVLIRYTYYGDSDFNGRVNFDDYVRTDAGFNNHLTGWLNGDYDLNGVVNFDDYVLIDLAFNTQSGTLGRALSFIDGSDRSQTGMNDPALREVAQHLAQFGSDYAQHFLSAVPEPGAAFAACGLALLATTRARRRRRLTQPYRVDRFPR